MPVRRFCVSFMEESENLSVSKLRQSRWVRWLIPLLVAVLFALVERQRVSTQIVARYPDFFNWADRASQFAEGDLSGLDWAHGLYPFGFPLLLWAGVRWLGLNALRTAFALSALGGVLGLLGAFALVRRLSGSYALALISQVFLACLGQYLYYGSAESTDMLASGLLIVSLAVLACADQRRRWVLVAGLVAGASYLIRYTASLTILLCAIYLFSLALAKRDRAWAIAGGAFVLGAVVGASPQLIASAIVKGNPLYSNQGHNLWFTLTGSVDYLGDWNAIPMDISILDVVRQYPRQVFDHWRLEFGNFWITDTVNFLGKPLYALLQAGFLFTVLWRDGLNKRARFLVGLYAAGHLALLAFMRLDKRFLLVVMPLFVFGAIYFLWQMLPGRAQAGRYQIPIRWPVMLALMVWAAAYPWGFRSSNDTDERTIQVSNVLHAAGMQSFRQVLSTELYLQDVADPFNRRFVQAAFTVPKLESQQELLNLLRDRGYRYFIYDKTTGKRLYPNLANLQFPDSRPAGLAPIFAPESGDLAVYRVLQSDNPTWRPVDASLADSVRLIGYESLVSEAQPRGRGQQLGVYLYWRTDQPLSQRYKVFVHVVNAEGKLVAQHDGEPQIGAYPTDKWEPGQVVCDFHSASLDHSLPSGSYSIRAGLYDEDSGKRLPVLNAGRNASVDDAIVLETLDIK
jgi:hypothetical protein